jgi:hypothetical protein
MSTCCCGGDVCEGQFYTCESCGHETPWCIGAADEFFEDCDACAVLKAEKCGGFMVDKLYP